VILLPNFTREEAASTAERIRSMIDADCPGGSLKVTVSIGIASSESGHTDAKMLIEAADKAMYNAKKKKNCVALS
jgi:diguanylate cyclase (GGDEF)-like protein